MRSGVVGVTKGDHIAGPGGFEGENRIWRQLADSLPCSLFLIDCDDTIIVSNARSIASFSSPGKDLAGEPASKALAKLANADGSAVDIGALLKDARSSDESVDLNERFLGIGRKRVEVDVSAFRTGPEAGQDLVTVTVAEAGDMANGSRMRDTVLSMVSHELRTPLLHIKGFVSSLLESDIEWDEETKLDFLRTIDREADRLTSMISDLSRISRMGSGDVPLHLELADPFRLAYAALDEASPFLHRHRAIVEVPEGMRDIHVDALRIMGTLVNLIENATKYSPEGSRIIVNAFERGPDLVYSVEDQGIGISRQVQDKIFDMFYRAESSGGSSKGSGLGLAVCKAVVNAHGGEIWVESDGKNGSTFYFSVPFGKERTGPSVRKTERASAIGKARRKRVAHANR